MKKMDVVDIFFCEYYCLLFCDEDWVYVCHGGELLEVGTQ